MPFRVHREEADHFIASGDEGSEFKIAKRGLHPARYARLHAMCEGGTVRKKMAIGGPVSKGDEKEDVVPKTPTFGPEGVATRREQAAKAILAAISHVTGAEASPAEQAMNMVAGPFGTGMVLAKDAGRLAERVGIRKAAEVAAPEAFIKKPVEAPPAFGPVENRENMGSVHKWMREESQREHMWPTNEIPSDEPVPTEELGPGAAPTEQSHGVSIYGEPYAGWEPQTIRPNSPLTDQQRSLLFQKATKHGLTVTDNGDGSYDIHGHPDDMNTFMPGLAPRIATSKVTPTRDAIEREMEAYESTRTPEEMERLRESAKEHAPDAMSEVLRDAQEPPSVTETPPPVNSPAPQQLPPGWKKPEPAPMAGGGNVNPPGMGDVQLSEAEPPSKQTSQLLGEYGRRIKDALFPNVIPPAGVPLTSSQEEDAAASQRKLQPLDISQSDLDAAYNKPVAGSPESMHPYMVKAPFGATPEQTAQAYGLSKPAPAAVRPTAGPTGGNGINESREITESTKAMQDAVMQRARAESDAAMANAQAQDYFMNQKSQIDNQFSQQWQQNQSRADDLYQKIINYQIKPENVWQNKTTGQRIGMAVAMILGGLGGGMSGQPNAAMQLINKHIDMDLESQKGNLDTMKTMMNWHLANGHDLMASHQLARADLLDTVAAMTNRNAALLSGQTAQQNGQILSQQLRQNASELRQRVAAQGVDTAYKMAQLGALKIQQQFLMARYGIALKSAQGIPISPGEMNFLEPGERGAYYPTVGGFAQALTPGEGEKMRGATENFRNLQQLLSHPPTSSNMRFIPGTAEHDQANAWKDKVTELISGLGTAGKWSDAKMKHYQGRVSDFTSLIHSGQHGQAQQRLTDLGSDMMREYANMVQTHGIGGGQ